MNWTSLQEKANACADAMEASFAVQNIAPGDNVQFNLDTQAISSALRNEGAPDQFFDIQDAFDAVAVLNAAVYELEGRLRSRGFSPTPRQGIICAFTYEIRPGYNYRENRKWFSLHPHIVIDALRP